MLSRLIYRSHALCSAEEGRQICADACERNRAAGITGALLMTQGVFVQYLEGEPQAVAAMSNRIQSDVRHTSCEVIDSRPIKGRVFSARPMQWLPLDAYTESIIKAFSPHDPRLTELSGIAADSLFQSLAETPLRG